MASSAPLNVQLASLRLMMDEATAAMQAGLGRQQEQIITRVMLDFLPPLKLVLREKPKLLPWSVTQSNTADKAAAQLILAEHRLVITSLASMTSKAVEHLNLIVDTDPFNLLMFKAILGLLFYTLELFSITPVCWPSEAYLLANVPVYKALDSLVTWHIKISRRPITVQQPSILLLLKTSCPNLLQSILKATFQCIMKLTEQPPSEACRLACKIPVGFLPRLCCQVCESCGADLLLPHPPRRDLCSWATLQLLVWTVWRCLTSAGNTPDGRAAMARVLLGPSFVVAAKMVVATFAITDPAQRPPCLNLKLLPDGIVAIASCHTLLKPWCGDFNTSSGGSATAPTPRVKFDNAMLVRAVRLIALEDTQLMEKCTSLLTVLLSVVPTAAPSQATQACLAGMVLHCSQQVQRRLRFQQKLPRRDCWHIQTMTAPAAGRRDPIMLELQILLFGCVAFAAQSAAASPRAVAQAPSRMAQWASSAGGVSVLEALLRDEHRPKNASDHQQAAAAVIFLMSSAAHSSSTLPASLSLAGTCHKLTLELMQTIATCRALGRDTMVAEVVAMEAFVQQHLITLLDILPSRQDVAQTAQGMSSIAAQVHDDHSNSSSSSGTIGSRNSSGGSGSNSGSSSSKYDSVSVMRRRLRAVVTLSLLQFEGFLVQISKRLPATSRPIWLRKLREQDAELADIVWQQLSTQHSPMAIRLLGQAAWEGYTLAHFHGRLMPGCCFVRCTNLAGCSEAALQTFLCRGCKRVRYCSLECQRTAWTAGGHRLVCGKGEWAC